MLSKEQIELIEQIGIYFEQGMPPAAARILALLIVAEEDSFSFDAVRESLKLSKSATSNGINHLLALKKIEYITKTGDRKRYFKWSPGNTMEHFKEGIEKILGLSKLFEQVIAQQANQHSNKSDVLRELTDLMNFLHEELPQVFQKWEHRKALNLAQK